MVLSAILTVLTLMLDFVGLDQHWPLFIIYLITGAMIISFVSWCTLLLTTFVESSCKVDYRDYYTYNLKEDNKK